MFNLFQLPSFLSVPTNVVTSAPAHTAARRPEKGFYRPGALYGAAALWLALLMLASLSGCSSRLPKPQQDVLIEAAQDNIEHGNFRQALSQLSQVLSEDPQNSEVLVNLAWIHLYLKNYDQAKEEIDQLEATSPKSPQLHYLKGRLMAGLQQWVDALEHYNQAMETDQINDPQLHADVAEAFMQLNEPEAALKEFKVAMDLDPKTAGYVFGMCRGYRQLKSYDKALETCKEAALMTIDPTEKEAIEQVIETIQLLKTVDESSTAVEPPTDH